MSGAVGKILWEPTDGKIAASHITAFMNYLQPRIGRRFPDYNSLHTWSVDHPQEFWRHIWEFCGVLGEGPGEVVLEDGGKMPGARWFPEARLNYAENLLRGEPGKSALVFKAEDGREDVWTMGQLRREVARIADGLLADGVKPGDRVAGFLPNIPETVVAMLATAAVGAVWSSCSPDFGPQGVMDRLGQIAPKVLVVAGGYQYGGKILASSATVEHLQANLKSLVRILTVPYPDSGLATAIGTTPWVDYGQPDAKLVFPRFPFAHPLFIMFSSGTTGLPKCMVHGAGGTLLQHLKEHQLHCDLGAEDRLFYYTTCGWMMWNWLVSGLASGATIVLYDGSPVKPRTGLWQLVTELGVTIFGTSARWLAACEKFGMKPGLEFDLENLNVLLSTGSPLAPESYDYVYEQVKNDLQLSSISGGTDIISCFALGCPILPVRRGELQCPGLGMQVEVVGDDGESTPLSQGELVCTKPFPSMPVAFWHDPAGTLYREAYFARFPGIWCHGDLAEFRPGGGLIIHGRSDTVLNPGGVRIGTAEIYRVVNQFDEVLESLVVGQQRAGDVRVVLFVELAEGWQLTEELVELIKGRVRQEASPRHVPEVVLVAPGLPRTRSGKLMETAVRKILEGREIDNTAAMANPEVLRYFREVALSLQ